MLKRHLTFSLVLIGLLIMGTACSSSTDSNHQNHMNHKDHENHENHKNH